MKDVRNVLFYFDTLQLHYSKLKLRHKVSLKLGNVITSRENIFLTN